jgi:hypothetical protein
VLVNVCVMLNEVLVADTNVVVPDSVTVSVTVMLVVEVSVDGPSVQPTWMVVH